ncbi:MAG TPA: LacI family DNA-binding transcriptional regulator [Ramlibacter sp.]|nr:LacI family DNA-binding transcriptional regulator [Ramlibacter sp.]
MNARDSNKRLTSKDIARIAGVSQTTVSRVLQGLPSVTDATREHVLSVIRSHNYHPSAAARSMKTSRTNSIAVVVDRLTNPLYPQLLQFVSAELHAHDLLMSVWESVPQFEDRLLRAIGEGVVDGVLTATATAGEIRLLKTLAEQRPVVLVHRTLEDAPLDQISSDNLAGGKSVAGHFLAGGRRRPGLITAPAVASTIRDRERGFRDALAAAGVALADAQLLRAEDFTYQCGYEAAQALLSRAPGLDCIFCANDLLAIGACDGLRAMGRVVPQDVWVIGYDDIPMAGWGAVGLSTMRQPLNVMARLAVQKLVARLNGETGKPETIRLHNELVVRATSG